MCSNLFKVAVMCGPELLVPRLSVFLEDPQCSEGLCLCGGAVKVDRSQVGLLVRWTDPVLPWTHLPNASSLINNLIYLVPVVSKTLRWCRNWKKCLFHFIEMHFILWIITLNILYLCQIFYKKNSRFQFIVEVQLFIKKYCYISFLRKKLKNDFLLFHCIV